MAITSAATRKAGPYTGNGATVAFPFNFKIFTAADLVVTQTSAGVDAVITTGFTVTLNANQDSNPGGTLTMTTAPATGVLITLTSQVAFTQPMVLTNNGGFFATVLNDMADRSVVLSQQMLEKQGRTLFFPVSDAVISCQLPGRVARANTVVAFDATGAPVVGPSLASVGTVAGNVASINTVAAGITNVNTLAGISGNIATLAAISANITTVAGATANIATVLGITANLAIVAGISTNVSIVASNASNLVSCVANMSYIQSATGFAQGCLQYAANAAASAVDSAASAAYASVSAGAASASVDSAAVYVDAAMTFAADAATQATLATSNGAAQVALAATQAQLSTTARLSAEAARDTATASWTSALAANPDLNPAVRMNPSTISTDTTIPSFYNASSVGPLTLAEGTQATINDNANWSIL